MATTAMAREAIQVGDNHTIEILLPRSHLSHKNNQILLFHKKVIFHCGCITKRLSSVTHNFNRHRRQKRNDAYPELTFTRNVKVHKYSFPAQISSDTSISVSYTLFTSISFRSKMSQFINADTHHQKCFCYTDLFRRKQL